MPEVTLDKSKFTHAVKIAESIIKKNSPLAPAQCVLIEWSGSQMQISSTGDAGSMTVSCEVLSCSGSGRVLIHPSRLEQFVSASRSDRVSMSYDDKDEKLVVKSGGRATFNTLDPETFPKLPAFSEDCTPVPGDEFRLAIKKSIALTYDAFGSQRIPVVYLDWRKGLYFVASSENCISIVGPAHTECKGVRAMIPVESAKILLKTDGDVGVCIEDKRVCFTSDNIQFSSPIAVWKFNKYDPESPPACDKTVAKASVGAMLAACRQVAAVADVETQRVKFEVANGEIAVSNPATQFGEAEIPVRCEHTGEDWTLVNNKYPLMFLALQDDDDDFELCIEESNMKTFRMNCGNHVYLVSPMTVVG